MRKPTLHKCYIMNYWDFWITLGGGGGASVGTKSQLFPSGAASLSLASLLCSSASSLGAFFIKGDSKFKLCWCSRGQSRVLGCSASKHSRRGPGTAKNGAITTETGDSRSYRGCKCWRVLPDSATLSTTIFVGGNGGITNLRTSGRHGSGGATFTPGSGNTIPTNDA